jgi:hypothetical protein
MAKNASRKTQSKSAKSVNKKNANNGASEAQKLKDKARDRELVYQIKTKRDEAVLKAFITFTYRVYHPGVTGRLIFVGILIAAPAIVLKPMWLKATCLIVGLLCILLAFFRQNISLALTKGKDPDYLSGAEFAYEFTEADASFYKNGELTDYVSKYKDIASFFYDDKFYYLAMVNKDLHILPKNRFTVGDPAGFEDFIYQRSKKTCKWIPDNFRDQMKKRRAYRQMKNSV